MENLLDFDLARMTDFLVSQGEKPFRAKQLLRWIHHFGEADFEQMTDIAKVTRQKLAAWCHIAPPELVT